MRNPNPIHLTKDQYVTAQTTKAKAQAGTGRRPNGSKILLPFTYVQQAAIKAASRYDNMSE